MSHHALVVALDRLLDRLLAPGTCLACGGALAAPASLCRTCAAALPRVANPCQACAQPNPDGGSVCPACRLNPPRWHSLQAAFAYRAPVRDWLLGLKYDGAPHFAKTLCREAAPLLRRLQPQPEVLLPVPLHRARLRQRGFNQAGEIATLLGKALDIPVDHSALRRCRDTASQSGLTASGRAANLRGAFSLDPDHGYRHVALVDDIVTTGATADEICRVLHRGGVETVRVWALARTVRD